jgi:multidrug resistance efflux pump
VLTQQKDYLTVVAPFNGAITQRAVELGGYSQPDFQRFDHPILAGVDGRSTWVRRLRDQSVSPAVLAPAC